MTLSEMKTYIGSKLGQSDSTSLGLIEGFIHRRYQMIADAHPWQDLKVFSTVSATAAAANVALPTTMDRVYSLMMQSSKRYLDPIDSAFALQADPDTYSGTGEPRYFEEYKNGSGVSQIGFYPTPDVNYTIVIQGRRVLTALTSGTSSAIRNIDNCLIAFATGDMLERQRQYAKAQAKFAEAQALLEQIRALETQQANKPRRTKKISVYGNTLNEMVDAVAARTDSWSPMDGILIREFMRRNYQSIYDGNLWNESTLVATVASDGSQIVLPEYFDRVLAVRADSVLGQLIPAQIGLLFSIAPNIFEQTTGAQIAFSSLSSVGVKVLPPGLEQLSIYSSSSNDKGSVFVRGESAGEVKEETVTLNGTTPVLTAYSYDVPLNLSKAATEGTITIKGAISTVELQRLLPRETERRHIRLWVNPANVSGQNFLILGKRKINPLTEDLDAPLLRDVQNILINQTSADMFARVGKPDLAAQYEAKAQMELQKLLHLEKEQDASQPRVVPDAEPTYDIYGCGDSFASDCIVVAAAGSTSAPAVSPVGYMYLPNIDDYSGGGATDFDSVNTVTLSLLTVIRIVTTNGESAWRLEAGTGTTDVPGGIIRPVDYDATTNARNWVRIAGY